MKKLSTLLVLLFSFTMLMAQEKTEFVIINYRADIQMDMETILKSVPEQFRAQTKSMLKGEVEKGIVLNYTLKTNGKKSVYQLDAKLDNSQTQGGMIANQIKQADKDPMFKDLEKDLYMKAVKIPGFKDYLISDSLNTIKWEITREKSKILNFEVRKAIGKRDSIEVIAWFAPKLAIKDGPDRFTGLPGLILKAEFEQNGADMTITATQVDIKEEEINIDLPKGKTVTEEQFKKEMEEFAEKMKAMMGNGVDTQ
ncbi:GLPGLI family protein [Weeksellaceae bacterium TAE3-ERU29]|nr:GLPGLI family protein [Weeksellaceae bacterium TAE3-ERU29]